MSYISDIVKLVKGGKESFVKKMKLYFYIAIGIAIYIIVFGFVLLMTHGVIMFTKNVPVIHSCPYNYSSYGLNAETSFPIIGTVVDTVVGIVYSNKRDPATCQKTCEKKCSDSPDETCLENCRYDCRYNGVKGGVLNGYRDSILNNLNFQIIRTVLVVFVISIIGVTFLFGFTPIRASEILKKLAILGLFLFATDSRSYVLYDQFIEPLVLEGSKQLAGMMNGILLASMDSPELIAYSNAHPNNEFIVLDASISIFFSQAIFDKMGALTFTDMSFMFMAPIFYLIATWITINYFFFSIIVVFYRIVIVVGLSLFPMFVLFTAMAITSKALDRTTKYFTNYIQEVLIKPTIAIFFLTYVMSFFAMLILELVLGVFSFQVCVKRVFTPPFGLDFVLPTFDYYEAVRPFSSKEVAGTILAFDTGRLDLPYINSTTNQIDPNSLEKRGNTDILFSMMILNFVLLSLYGILFRKIFGVVIQTAEKLNAAFGGSGLGDGGGGFKDIMDKASEYGKKAGDLASQKIEAVGDSAISQMTEASQQSIGRDMESIGKIGNTLKEGVNNLGNAAKENFTKAMESIRDNKNIEDEGKAGGGAPSEDGGSAENQTESQEAGTGGVEGGDAGNIGEIPGEGGAFKKAAGIGGASEVGNAGIGGGASISENIPTKGGGLAEKTSTTSSTSQASNASSESTSIEPQISGKPDANEPAKEVQRERDVIKKTIRSKQNIENEEFEGGEAPSEAPSTSANNVGESTATMPLKTPVASPEAIEAEAEDDEDSEEIEEEEGGNIQESESGEIERIEESTQEVSTPPAIQDVDNQSFESEGGEVQEFSEGSQDISEDAMESTTQEDSAAQREDRDTPTVPENSLNSPLGHDADKVFEHGANSPVTDEINNPIKNEIDTPFNLPSSNQKGGEPASFESKIEEVKKIKEDVEKKAELMAKVQAAKEKKNFLDQNVKAVSNKENIAKFRKRSGFLNNQNKDKK